MLTYALIYDAHTHLVLSTEARELVFGFVERV
jgi:hypothetical protein